MDESLDQLVRRVDEDRWLASRFAPTQVRQRLAALYALNYEIARTAEVVTQPALGDIRLAWWRDALTEIYQGHAPRGHPVLAAFAAALPGANWPRAMLDDIIAARAHDLEAAPFESWAALDAYLDATGGTLMRLAVHACSAELATHAEALVIQGARAWGYVGMARAGRVGVAGVEDMRAALLQGAGEAFASARSGVKAPSDAFPALGHLALIPVYLRALASGKRDVPVLRRQLRLIGAAASGRV